MNKEYLIKTLTKSINDVFKILPLYEDKNDYLIVYIDSLLFKLRGLELQNSEYKHDYYSILTILNSIKIEIKSKEYNNKPIIKREVFKSINIIKKIISKLEVSKNE